MAWRNKLKELDREEYNTNVNADAKEEEDLKAIGGTAHKGAIHFSLDSFKTPETPDSPEVVTRKLPPPPQGIRPLSTSNSSQNMAPVRTLPPKPIQEQHRSLPQQTPPPPVRIDSAQKIQPKQKELDENTSETELLRQQVAQLQLRNQELQEEAHKNTSLRLSQSLYDAIENDDEETEEDIMQIASAKKMVTNDDFDDYFHVQGGNYASKLVTSVAEGLSAYDVCNMIPWHDDYDWVGYEYDLKDLREREENAYCQMHRIRGLEDKSVLLQTLVNEPMALMPALMWCEQSLSFQNFSGLLMNPTLAPCARAYVGHLKRLGDTRQLSRMYAVQDNVADECMLRVKHALLVENPTLKLEALEDCITFLKNNQERLKRYCDKNNLFDISSYNELINDAYNLLARQLKIDQHDAMIAQQGKEMIYLEHPRFNITGTTVSTSLRYLLFYHPYADDTKLSSPRAFAKMFKLSQHRYIYEAMHTRARIGDWKAVHHLFDKAKQANLCYMSSFEFKDLQSTTGVTGFLKKKLNTGSKDSYSVLAVNNFISTALEFNAPPQVFEILLNEVENPEERYELAKSRQVWGVAIKCAVELKDRELLQAIRKEVVDKYTAEESSALRLEIDQLLHGNKIKWKATKETRGSGKGLFGWFK